MAWTLPRPYLILGVALALCVVSVIYAALELDFQTAQLDLISPDDPLIKLSQEIKQFQKKDTFTVVVEAHSPKRAVEFVRALQERIEADPSHFSDVFVRVDPEALRPWSLLYLDMDDLQLLNKRLDEYPTLMQGIVESPNMVSFLDLVNQEMASRMVDALFTDFLRAPKDEDIKGEEPMDLGFLIATLQGFSNYLEGRSDYVSPWSSLFKESNWDRETSGYFWVADKKFLLVFVTPVREKDTFNKAQASLERLRSFIQEVRSSFPDVQVGVTGQEALKTDEMTIALRDMSWATWISFVGVWVLNVAFFKSHTRTLVRMAVLAMGMCWTFGFLTLAIGHLNILSMVFAPMLVGLGDDYAVHWFARLEEEEKDPTVSRREAILNVATKSGPAILTAGISGALSFLPLVLTGFKGLVELGLISGTGILLQVIVDFVALPVLSLWGKKPAYGKPSTDPLRDHLRLNRRRALAVLGISTLVSAGAILGTTHVRFDLNPLRLQAKGTESVVWEEKLRENSKRSVLFASSWASSLEELEEKTRALRELPVVWKVQSVLSLLPESQEEKIPFLRSVAQKVPPSLKSPMPDVRPDPQLLSDLLERIRFKMDDSQAESWGAKRPVLEQITEVRSLTGKILDQLKGPRQLEDSLVEYQRRFQEDLQDVFDLLASASSVNPMTPADIPKSLWERFVSEGKFLIRIFPSEDIWEPGPREEFVSMVRSVDPRASGDAVTLHVFTKEYQRACLEASIYALLGIGILLFVEFRGSPVFLLAFLPLILGTLWTVGTMAPLGISFNLANSVFLPLIVGAGVEYGIIIVHRWKEGSGPSGTLPWSTAKGVLCASLTTNLGFGTLMICRHQGIFSLGVLSFVGSMLVLAAAVLVLPAVIGLLGSKE